MSEPRRIRPGSPDWSSRLGHLPQPPGSLWVTGTIPPRTPAVAVVGSRRATFGGLEVAAALGRDLAASGIQVVSGMARGVDAAAHHGALDACGTTIAVLGCGIDICYPPEHQRLRAAIEAHGMVVAEEAPGCPPLRHNFPKRNRIIAALVLAVVVVEATERSGALSTARWAIDLGREVLAVPGSIRSRQSSGTNMLIRDGARPFLGVDDLFDAVPELTSSGAPLRGGGETNGADDRIGRFSPPLREILTRMGPDPVHPDQVGEQLGLPAGVVAARLGALELAGAVRSLPGGLVGRTV